MGYVGLDRGIIDHWIYQDAEYFKVWFEMLHRARFGKEPYLELVEGELVEVNYAEFIFGRIKWSKRLKVSEQRLRTLIKKLIAENMLEVVLEHRKCTIYRIKNYAKFNQQSNQQNDQPQQEFEEPANQQNNLHLTSSQPAVNQQLTTKEERNKEKNDKKEIKEKNPNRKQVYDEDSSPYKLAVYLYSKISEWTDQVNLPNLQTWANECRLILEIDKRDKQTVKDVIDWATKDDFWQSNILSPKSLRKQFVRLSVGLNKSIHTNNGNYSSDLKIIAGGQAKGKPSTTSKIQELYRQAEEDERREAHGGY